jgi:hypothetical protein
MSERWLWDYLTIHADEREHETARADVGKEGRERGVEVFDFGSGV